jgi:CheY-like chemotaxis protein
MNRLVLREMLKRKFGLFSDEARNGEECLEAIHEKSVNECCGEYKIIFMDFEMPVMDGL